MSVGNYIRELRERKGMSLTDFASEVGVSKSSMHRYEYGIIEGIPLTVLVKIAKLLNVTLDELVNGRKEDLSGISMPTPLGTIKAVKQPGEYPGISIYIEDPSTKEMTLISAVEYNHSFNMHEIRLLAWNNPDENDTTIIDFEDYREKK